jgi:hypothetical protein
MKYYNDDDLDRALFNLPLEEAPANLRAAILAGTIYRQTLPVKPWEVWLMGGCVAMIAWFIGLILRGGPGPVASALDVMGAAILTVVSQPATLLWIALGGAAAMWISQLSPAIVPARPRAVRR